ncbi:hypothetical protein ILYODFUR_003537 [Ilyodon furcidens]|uniref:Biglycan n=1 Tax=Ilyodon furcidens TaxID=33524 RepID=A0ABV0T619_9TELE
MKKKIIKMSTKNFDVDGLLSIMSTNRGSNSRHQHFCNHSCRLGLGFNQIRSVENGSLASIPNIQEIHLDHNRLKKVPPGLASLRYLQVIFLHRNKISNVGFNDFCPRSPSEKKNPYTAISLFANPVKYWSIQPATFRCVASRRGIQFGNFRRK